MKYGSKNVLVIIKSDYCSPILNYNCGSLSKSRIFIVEQVIMLTKSDTYLENH